MRHEWEYDLFQNFVWEQDLKRSCSCCEESQCPVAKLFFLSLLLFQSFFYFVSREDLFVELFTVALNQVS